MAVDYLSGTAATVISSETGATSSGSYDSGSTGSDRLLVVAVFYEFNTSQDITAITYNGVAMTHRVSELTETGTVTERMEIWTLANPATGSNALAITQAQAGNDVAVVAAVFTGAHQVNVGTTLSVHTPELNPTAQTVAFSENGGLAVYGHVRNRATAGVWSPAANNIELIDATIASANAGFSYCFGYRGPEATAGNYTVGASNSTANLQPTSQCFVELIEAGGGDVTPPTLSSPATNVAGTEITATLSESGCVADGGGTTGTGGFTLAGTSATVASWAISGTTLTLTLTGTVENGETVTYSYARASTTDDIKDAAGNYLADFSTVAVTNNVPGASLAAGTASFVSSGPDGISVEATAPTGGTSPYTYQWERNEDGGSYADLTGETALACDDATATTEGVLYGYRCKQTDDVAATVTTNTITAQVYSGGTLTGGASSVFQSSVIRGA